ncbi:MAG: hypothetical protein HKN09_10585 [Saprospiraceae bacterium]|nr:hypothetical protein [Saprospiraceae bacterium]
MSLCFIFLFSSCTRQLSYFTQDLQDDYQWSESELKKIQFFLSEDIHLQAAQSRELSTIEDGSITIESGSKIERIIIKAGTPGVVVFTPKSDRFAVSFDKDPDKYLIFGPSPKYNDRYVLLAKKWRSRTGIITYGGKEYRTSSENAYAALMVDVSKARKISTINSTATGRTIDDN